MRKFIIPALVGSLALGGCQTFDNTIRENLADACAVVETAHSTFVDLSASITIAQRYIDSVEAAYASVQTICLHPETATTIVVISRVIAASSRIYAILTQVTQANPAALEAIQ